MIRLSCNSLFSMGPKLDNFCGKNLLMALFPLSKSWLRFWSHLLLLTDFSSDYMGRIRNELKNAAGVMCLFFSDMNTKFFRHEYEIRNFVENRKNFETTTRICENFGTKTFFYFFGLHLFRLIHTRINFSRPP